MSYKWLLITLLARPACTGASTSSTGSTSNHGTDNIRGMSLKREPAAAWSSAKRWHTMFINHVVPVNKERQIARVRSRERERERKKRKERGGERE